NMTIRGGFRREDTLANRLISRSDLDRKLSLRPSTMAQSLKIEENRQSPILKELGLDFDRGGDAEVLDDDADDLSNANFAPDING
ncbi:MAG: hypothetical protein LBT64_03780, partial [Puniceicoccales bacterium]|nr:hypothetical protein [Puniceicoccales bacterium]